MQYVGYKVSELGDKLKKGLIFSFEKKDPDDPLNEHPQGYRVSHVAASFVSYAPLSKVEERKDCNGKRYLYIPSTARMDYDRTIYILEEVAKEDYRLPLDDYYKHLSAAESLQMTCYALSWVIGLTEQLELFLSSYGDTLEQIYDAREKQAFQMWYTVQLDNIKEELSVWTTHVNNLARSHRFTYHHISKYVNKHKNEFTDYFLTKYKDFYK